MMNNFLKVGLILSFAFTANAFALETSEKCIEKGIAKWEKKNEKEVAKWCADLAKRGEECRISAGQEEAARQEALEKITAKCH